MITRIRITPRLQISTSVLLSCALLLLLAAQLSGQVKQQAAVANCSNIVVNSGTVRITCTGLTSDQLKEIQSIPDLLTRLLKTQHEDTEKIISKINKYVEQAQTPLVVNSRPPEFLQPFTCSPTTGLKTGNMQITVKNIGNRKADDVFAMLLQIKIVPEKKTGNPLFDDIPKGDCDAKINPNPLEFTMAPGEEKRPQIRQMGSMGMPPISDGDPVQLYAVNCIYYSDEYRHHHGTCDTYRLSFPSSEPLDAINGTPTFVCDGRPKIARFQEALEGHCKK